MNSYTSIFHSVTRSDNTKLCCQAECIAAVDGHRLLLTVTRILDLRLSISRRRPSVSTVTACLDAEYIDSPTPAGGTTWPRVLVNRNVNIIIWISVVCAVY